VVKSRYGGNLCDQVVPQSRARGQSWWTFRGNGWGASKRSCYTPERLLSHRETHKNSGPTGTRNIFRKGRTLKRQHWDNEVRRTHVSVDQRTSDKSTELQVIWLNLGLA